MHGLEKGVQIYVDASSLPRIHLETAVLIDNRLQFPNVE